MPLQQHRNGRNYSLFQIGFTSLMRLLPPPPFNQPESATNTISQSRPCCQTYNSSPLCCRQLSFQAFKRPSSTSSSSSSSSSGCQNQLPRRQISGILVPPSPPPPPPSPQVSRLHQGRGFLFQDSSSPQIFLHHDGD